MPSKPLLVTLSLLLVTRSVPRTAGKSIRWWGSNPGPTSELPTTDRWLADESTLVQQLELIDHMLYNDRQWGRMLRQGVKLTKDNLPPYYADDDATATDPEVRALLRVIDTKAEEGADETFVTPLQVMQQTARFRWIGSYVEYTSYVTRTAFTCFTYLNARLAVYMIWRMWELAKKNAIAKRIDVTNKASDAVKHGLPPGALDQFRALMNLMARTMAAMHGDLTSKADTLFDQALTALLNPDYQYLAISVAYYGFHDYIEKRCQPVGNKDVFINMGCGTYDGSLHSLNLEQLTRLYSEMIICAIEKYDGFDVEAVPLNAWAYLVDYDQPVVRATKFLQSKIPVNFFDVRQADFSKYK